MKSNVDLPNELREAVVLFEYEDMSHEQIAAVAGCSRKAVETRLYRARAILREKLKQLLS
jgi:RNA polymerase sigma-70 factor (ECF subfamily)